MNVACCLCHAVPVLLQSDNCITRRMLSAARLGGYRVARTLSYRVLIDANEDDMLGVVCSCEFINTDPHCRLVLPEVR